MKVTLSPPKSLIKIIPEIPFKWILDDHYNRTDKLDKSPSFLDSVQKEWLKKSLLDSKATFKFLATCNQTFSPMNKCESFKEYPEELDEILDLVNINKFSG